MSIKVVPNLIQVGDGDDSTLVALGSHAGGNDMAFKLGGENRAMVVKRDGVTSDATDNLEGLPKAGSGIVAQSYGLTSSLLSAQVEPSVGSTPRYVMVNVPAAALIYGAQFFLTVPGVFTPGPHNEVGLYSFDGGLLTRIAISSSDPTIWTTTPNLVQVPFITPVNVVPGIYFIGAMYDGSPISTAPLDAAAPTVIAAYCSELDLINSGRTYGDDRLNHALPDSITMGAGIDPSSERPWFAIYTDPALAGTGFVGFVHPI